MPPSVEKEGKAKPIVRRTLGQSVPSTQKQSRGPAATAATSSSQAAAASTAVKKAPQQATASKKKTPSSQSTLSADGVQQVVSKKPVATFQTSTAAASSSASGKHQAPPATLTPATAAAAASRRQLSSQQVVEQRDAQAKSAARAATVRGMTAGTISRAAPSSSSSIVRSAAGPTSSSSSSTSSRKASSQQDAAVVVQRKTRETAGPAATSRPGAVSVVDVSSSSASGLEKAVMQKATRAAAVGPSTRPSPVVSRKQRIQLERDVQAKKKRHSAGTTVTSRPGAVPVASALESAVLRKARSAGVTSSSPSPSKVTSTARCSLPSTQGPPSQVVGRDTQAKNAATSPSTDNLRPGAVNVDDSSADLESAVMSKARRAATTVTSTGTATASKAASVSPAQGRLPQLEQNVQAKKAGRVSAALTPGAVLAGGNAILANLNSWENAVANKVRTQNGNGSQSQFNTLVKAKAVAARSAPSAAAAPGAVTVSKKGRAELASLETKAMTNMVSAAAPGAVTVSTQGRAELASLETKAMTNMVLSGRSHDSCAQSNKSQLESYAMTKAGAANGSHQTQGGRTELNQMESDVLMSKNTTSSGRQAASVRTQLNQLESYAMTKAGAANGSHQTPGGRTELNQMESDVLMSKNATSRDCHQTPGGQTELNQMESDVLMSKNTTSRDLSEQDYDTALPYSLDEDYTEMDTEKEATIRSDEGGIFQQPDAETDGDLAVAVAVEQEEQVDAVAIEYDPDAKPSFHKTKLFKRSALIAFLTILVVGAAVAGILLAADRDGGDGISPREKLGIREEVESVIGAEELESLESPYSKALDWIIYDDPMELVPEDSNFFQRYITAYIYFSTTTGGPWRSCNPPVGNQKDFCYFAELNRDYQMHPPHFFDVPATRWLTSVHECQFAGVVCDDEQIVGFQLHGAGMSGSFPTGIVHFPFLEVVEFGVGTMTGPLPTELTSSLPHLSVIDVRINEFTGEIPVEWYQSGGKLNVINLSYNRIEGTISSQVQNLKELKSLSLNANELSGPLPPELGSLFQKLVVLELGQNKLEGTIPTELGELNSLTELWLHQNLLTATLPLELGNMTELTYFSVGDNTRLSGTIPDEIYELRNMMVIEMHGCNFTGPLSPLIGQNMPELVYARFNDNSFTGTLPVELAECPLQSLEVQNNKLQGKVPQDFCYQRGGDGVNRGLQFLVADCSPDPATSEVELECDCCTTCCTPDGFCTEEAIVKGGET